MTLAEKVVSYLGFEPSGNAIASALQDAGFADSSVEYVATNMKGVKKATITVIDILFTTANATNHITGTTMTYDRNALLKYRNKLAGEIGEPQIGEPRITAPCVW